MRATPLMILEMWEYLLNHKLSGDRRPEFLGRHEVVELSKLPDVMVARAAVEAKRSNHNSELLLTEWLDVAAEHLEALLARNRAREAVERREWLDPDGAHFQKDGEDTEARDRELAAESPEEREERIDRERLEWLRWGEEWRSLNAPKLDERCRVCGRSSVHAHDCTLR